MKRARFLAGTVTATVTITVARGIAAASDLAPITTQSLPRLLE
jgi:hypothetical protein